MQLKLLGIAWTPGTTPEHFAGGEGGGRERNEPRIGAEANALVISWFASLATARAPNICLAWHPSWRACLQVQTIACYGSRVSSFGFQLARSCASFKGNCFGTSLFYPLFSSWHNTYSEFEAKTVGKKSKISIKLSFPYCMTCMTIFAVTKPDKPLVCAEFLI